MLAVKPIQEKKVQEEFCNLCGVSYVSENFAYAIFDNQEFIGICDFAIAFDCGYLFSLANKNGYSDIDALEIAGRATLSFMENCGVKKVTYNPQDDIGQSLAKRMKFKLCQSGIYTVDLEGYFDHPCQN